MAFQEHSSDVEDRVTPFSCEAADIQFSGEMLFRWEGHEPYGQEFSGHSPDSICLVLDGKYLFPGDTIFCQFLQLPDFREEVSLTSSGKKISLDLMQCQNI